MIYRLCVLVDFDLEAWVCIFPHFLRSNPDTFKDLFQEGTLAAFSAFFVPLPAVVIQGKAYDDTRFTLQGTLCPKYTFTFAETVTVEPTNFK